MRQKVALSWMQALPGQLNELYSGQLGTIHRDLLASSLKDFAMREDEARVLKSIISQTRIGPGIIENANGLLAAALYLYPHQMPVETNIELIPDWFVKDYCKFLFTPPRLFQQIGEVDAYYQYFSKIVDLLHHRICIDSATAPWLKMGVLFIEHANFIPLYACQKNLKDLYVKRAEITRQILSLTGFQLDYTMPHRSPHRSKIRLGIYTRSLAANTETLASLPVYLHLNPAEFEKYIYVHTQNGSCYEQAAHNGADKFTVLPVDIKHCVEMMRRDDLDILFFSNNLTAVSNEPYFLASHRIARIQCVHFCQPNTTGQPFIDYFVLGDFLAKSVNPEQYYSEQVIALTGSAICFEHHASNESGRSTLTRESLGIPADSRIFISGANFFKIIPELIHFWANIVSAVEDSVLILYPFGPAWSNNYPKSSFVRNFENIFHQYGIKKERIKILDLLPAREDVMELLKLADVYLDAVPYSGATSLLDPLEIGIPPVVMQGKDLRFSQGAAILKELGVSRLIARTEVDYFRLAVTIAQNQEYRRSLKNSILAKMQLKPCFLNSRLYAQEMERALKILAHQHEIIRHPDTATGFSKISARNQV